AFVKRKRDRAGQIQLRGFDEGVQSFAQRREPQAEINQLGILERDVLLEVQQIAIEAEGFEFAMSRKQQRASGSFIASARLDADETVLDNIDASDRVASADFVHQFDERYRVERLSADRNRYTLLESDFNLLFFVRGLWWRFRQLPGASKRRVGSVFKLSAFVAEMPEIAIAAVNFLAARAHCNAALLGIVEAVFARLEIPLAPRRHDFQFG